MSKSSDGGCCAEDGECCELIHVLSSLGALALSALAAFLALEHAGDLSSCLEGLGPGVSRLQNLLFTLMVNYSAIITVNVASTVVVWLSFFDCDTLECDLKHKLTSARSLSILLGAVWVTFFMQLFRLGYAMTLHGVLAGLAYICNLGPGVVYLAQELVYAMGNATETGAAVYSPYGREAYGRHYAWSLYIDVGEMVKNFNFERYCEDTDHGKDDGAGSVMYGCLLTLLSQALMAMALSGEKARVVVHDLHEKHTLVGMAQQIGGQAQHSIEQLPLMGQNLTQGVQQAFHDPSAFANGLSGKFSSSFNGAADRFGFSGIFPGGSGGPGYVPGTLQSSLGSPIAATSAGAAAAAAAAAAKATSVASSMAASAQQAVGPSSQTMAAAKAAAAAAPTIAKFAMEHPASAQAAAIAAGVASGSPLAGQAAAAAVGAAASANQAASSASNAGQAMWSGVGNVADRLTKQAAAAAPAVDPAALASATAGALAHISHGPSKARSGGGSGAGSGVVLT